MKTCIIIFFISLIFTKAFPQNTTTNYLSIKNTLDSIYAKDQNLRNQLDSLEENSLVKPAEIEAFWRKIKNQDSINLIQVTNIIDHYGWLGPDKIGTLANSTIFLVIQHSNLKTMEKYRPVMKEAVDRGNAQKSSYAMLVDRIEMLNHRPQIYGTQIQMINGNYKLYKVLDEQNLNKRRQEMGLSTIEEYLAEWDIKQ